MTNDKDANVRPSWEHGPAATRLLALVNVALIPVRVGFLPARRLEATRGARFGAVLRGK